MPPTGPCTIRLAEVRDVRSDPSAMGSVGTRVVRAADAAAWVRSGLQSLNRDSRIRAVDDSGADGLSLTLSVDLVQAYTMTITTEKSTNVVLRVRYDRRGSPIGEQTYRGTDTSLNWTNGDAEIQSSFNAALAQLLLAVDRDILARCDNGMAARSAMTMR